MSNLERQRKEYLESLSNEPFSIETKDIPYPVMSEKPSGGFIIHEYLTLTEAQKRWPEHDFWQNPRFKIIEHVSWWRKIVNRWKVVVD